MMCQFAPKREGGGLPKTGNLITGALPFRTIHSTVTHELIGSSVHLTVRAYWVGDTQTHTQT